MRNRLIDLEAMIAVAVMIFAAGFTVADAQEQLARPAVRAVKPTLPRPR